jgi:hypothetical protein
MRIRSVLFAFAIVMVAAPAAFADGSAVAGVVKFKGKAPAKTQVNKGAPATCGTDPVYDETVVVDDKGGLANTVVYLDGAPKTAAPTKDVVLDQKGCHYLPHVQAGTVGSKLDITNSDQALHTAHAYGKNDVSLYNVATPSAGSKATQKLDQLGPTHFKCDAGHTWMSAWIYTFDHPYFAVTDANGKFSIANVPAGTYTVKAWHEKFGEVTGKVTVTAGKPGAVDLEYK